MPRIGMVCCQPRYSAAPSLTLLLLIHNYMRTHACVTQRPAGSSAANCSCCCTTRFALTRSVPLCTFFQALQDRPDLEVPPALRVPQVRA